MAMLIKKNRVTDDPWTKIDDPNQRSDNAPSYSILPIDAFHNQSDWPIKRTRLGAWFDADIELSMLSNEILSLPLLCIYVDDFNHGQVFSLAQMIKQNLNYAGELRVMGNILIDQMPYLKRCGVDSFSLSVQSDWEYALFVLNQAPTPSRFSR